MSNLVFDIMLSKRNGQPRPPWETALIVAFWILMFAAGWWIGGRV